MNSIALDPPVSSPRASHEDKQAVDNIQRRFLDRVGNKVVRGLSRRELHEELAVEALSLSSCTYGCVLRCEKNNTLQLDAAVTVDASGHVSRLYGELMQTSPDVVINDVVQTRKPMFSNNAHDIALGCLPAGHPPIENFMLCPLTESGTVEALLLVANTRDSFDLVQMKRLQSMIDAFLRLHVSTIVNQGIDSVISDVNETHRQMLNLLEASFNAVLTVDEQLCITAYNPACEKLFQLNTVFALGKPLESFVNADTLEAIKRRAAQFSYSLVSEDEKIYKLNDALIIGADNNHVPVELMVFHAKVDEQIYTTLVLNDISHQLHDIRELKSTAIQYQTLTQQVPVGIVKLNEQWLCEYANEMWCQLTRRGLGNNLGSGWIEGIHTDDQAQSLLDMRNSLLKGDTYKDVIRLGNASEESNRVSINATALMNNMEQFCGALVVIMDVTEQYESEQQFRQIAHHDPLTGLPNRTRFLEDLHHSLMQRSTYGIVCLLIIDLDGFKAVNDTLGHDAGDELLQQVALRLRQTISTDDTVARLGGDEFTVTIKQLKHQNDASEIAESIVQAIKQPFLLQQEEVYVSASIGIAVAAAHGSSAASTNDANSIIKQADIAMYRAKVSGRSRYVFFTAELDQAQRDRSVLITSLRRAVDRQDFELFYQPQLLIKKDQLMGFEALLRWPQEMGEYISPGDFIDVLEETGLIGELGEWAISQACGQHRIWLRRGLIGPATTMSVNVSARQLSTPHFADRVAAILERHSMPPYSLILEITESALVETIETNIINEIKALGVQISLDDFGTGYSSLAYLSQLPLDHLKIDRSFIADIEKFPHAVSVVKSIIALANTLGIRVIAEGVESASVLPLLANEGCEGYQGFHFSQPLPAREMATRLKQLEKVRLSHYANFVDLGSAFTS